MSGEDHGATVRAWTDVIRRAQLDKLIRGTHASGHIKGPTVKMIALTIASYADANGRRVFPGVARLAADTGISYRIAGRCVVGLRDLGLIELVRRAVRRGARSEREKTDEYRLTLPPDLLDRMTVPTPSDYREIVAKVARPHRPALKARSDSDDSTASTAPLDSAPAAESNRDSGTPNRRIQPRIRPDLTAHKVPAKVSLDLDTRTTSHPEEKVGGKLTVPRAREAAEEDPNFGEGVTGPPTLRVVTGRPAGVTPAPAQRGLWPAPVPPLPPAADPVRSLTPGEQARIDVRRLLADRKRGRASA